MLNNKQAELVNVLIRATSSGKELYRPITGSPKTAMNQLYVAKNHILSDAGGFLPETKNAVKMLSIRERFEYVEVIMKAPTKAQRKEQIESGKVKSLDEEVRETCIRFGALELFNVHVIPKNGREFDNEAVQKWLQTHFIIAAARPRVHDWPGRVVVQGDIDESGVGLIPADSVRFYKLCAGFSEDEVKRIVGDSYSMQAAWKELKSFEK